jgi:DNA-binding NtrC family response regulator
LGYAVLHAENPGQALSLAKAYGDKIQLLITDVVMPEMSGKDLSAQIKVLSPEIKILFMSGYTSDIIAHRGILEKDIHFIQKPFSIKDLSARVREALEDN